MLAQVLQKIVLLLPVNSTNFTMSRHFVLEGGNTRHRFGESSYGSCRSGRSPIKPRVPPSLALEIERIRDHRQLPKILRPHGPFWNWIFLTLCVGAVSLDPLFLYIPVINDEKKCLRLDKKLAIVAMILRSFLDLVHLIYVILRLRTNSFAPCWEYPQRSLNEYAQEITRKYLQFFLPVDLLSILPLPQVLILMIIQTTRGSKVLNGMKWLKFFIIFQYVPRLIRIYPLFTKVTRTSGKLDEATLLKAAFNLILYMTASHVFGAFWYFFSIAREVDCWNGACVNHTGCSLGSFYCRDNAAGDNTFVNDFCPTKVQNTTIFDFGIFNDALQSGIVEVTAFPQKFSYCFLWGLQNLSCFGQNIHTSSYVWENVFAIVITISGLLFFLYLIGNVQIYLQSKTIRSEEMRLKGQELEQWMGFRKLSRNLQQKLRKYRQYIWQETKGVDVENLLNNLPYDLKRNIKSELGLELLWNVPLFQNLDAKTLDDICSYLKPVLYPAESHIVQEGDPIDGMLFVMQGNLWSATMVGGRTSFHNGFYLNAGDYFGEELISWVMDPESSSYLPVSSRTVRAVTEVEAFALMSKDFTAIGPLLWRTLNCKQIRHAFRNFSHQWRTWAARFILAAWLRYKRRKLEASLYVAENNLQDERVAGGGITSSLGATVYPSRFAAHALLATQSTLQVMIRESVGHSLLQKPTEPDFRLDVRKMLMKVVPPFQKLDTKTLDDICDNLKLVQYKKASWVVREGGQVDKMLFIRRGVLESTTSNGETPGSCDLKHLRAGDFCGEELVTWVMDFNSSFNLPISTRTVIAETEVEAFALMADDLKLVAPKSRELRRKHLLYASRYHSQQRRTWASRCIQAAWRRRYNKPKGVVEGSSYAEENGGSSPSLGAIIYATLFALKALRAIRRRGTRKTESVSVKKSSRLFASNPRRSSGPRKKKEDAGGEGATKAG